jgi:tripartite-type tricarboxylate transporter receptor subunit TctC
MNRLGHLCIGPFAATVTPLAASAQDYPTKPIRLVVVTAAGGLMDVAARVTAEHLSNALGQRVVVENRGGSGGNLGAEAVAKAEPDGHTIGLIQVGNVAIKPLHLYRPPLRSAARPRAGRPGADHSACSPHTSCAQ